MIDLFYQQCTPERRVFQELGLVKQARQGKPRARVFLPRIYAKLCPHQHCIQLYNHVNAVALM